MIRCLLQTHFSTILSPKKSTIFFKFLKNGSIRRKNLKAKQSEIYNIPGYPEAKQSDRQSKVGKVKAKQNGIRSGLCLPLKNRINGMDAVEIEG